MARRTRISCIDRYAHRASSGRRERRSVIAVLTPIPLSRVNQVIVFTIVEYQWPRSPVYLPTRNLAPVVQQCRGRKSRLRYGLEMKLRGSDNESTSAVLPKVTSLCLFLPAPPLLCISIYFSLFLTFPGSSFQSRVKADTSRYSRGRVDRDTGDVERYIGKSCYWLQL